MGGQGDIVYGLAHGMLANLRHVRRYTGCFLHHEENVAEHSWFVSVFALAIAVDCIKRGYEVQLEAVLPRAILHDVEEGVTGDFPRPFKYSNAALKQHLDEAAERGAIRMLNSVAPHNGEVLDELMHYWSSAKEKNNNGWIVSFADLLAFLELVLREVRAGNRAILEYTTEVKAYLESFEKCEMLGPYVHDAKVLFMEIQSYVK